MQLNVTFRHMEPADELKEYVEQRFKKLKKYADSPMKINVVLSVEKFRNSAEVVISGDGIRAAAKEEHQDMKAAIDLVSDKIEKQLKKYREKLVNKRGSEPTAPATPQPAMEGQEADFLIHVEKIESKPMTVEEAVEQLQLQGSTFFAFLNADTNRVNVVHWRKDGTLGLIEP